MDSCHRNEGGGWIGAPGGGAVSCGFDIALGGRTHLIGPRRDAKVHVFSAYRKHHSVDYAWTSTTSSNSIPKIFLLHRPQPRCVTLPDNNLRPEPPIQAADAPPFILVLDCSPSGLSWKPSTVAQTLFPNPPLLTMTYSPSRAFASYEADLMRGARITSAEEWAACHSEPVMPNPTSTMDTIVGGWPVDATIDPSLLTQSYVSSESFAYETHMQQP